MRILKNKVFNKWAAKERISDGSLRAAVDQMEQGLVDADLGGHVFKKRVATTGRGKSGGVRTLLVYQVGSKAFFVYGFAKNARANIKDDELEGLKKLANVLLAYTDEALADALESGALIEVEDDG